MIIWSHETIMWSCLQNKWMRKGQSELKALLCAHIITHSRLTAQPCQHFSLKINDTKMYTSTIFVFTLCAFVAVQSYECNFPPNLWCSSKEIAAKCQVLETLFSWSRVVHEQEITYSIFVALVTCTKVLSFHIFGW